MDEENRPINFKFDPVSLLFFSLLTFIITGCQQVKSAYQPKNEATIQSQSFTIPSSTPTNEQSTTAPSAEAPATVPELNTPLPTISPSAPAPTDSLALGEPLTATHQPESRPTLSADDPVFLGTSIDELTARGYGLGEFVFTETITRNTEFHQYTFEYLSDDQIVEGFLTLPTGTGDFGEKFPVVVLLHGYVKPDDYELFPYSTRYVMPFVEAGYIVIHPSYRGHPPKPGSSGSNVFRIEYAIDVLNLIALVREGSEDPTGPFRRADKDNLFLWGHSMGGGIAQRVLTVRPDWVSGAALYASMSGDEAQNYERIRAWGDDRTWQTESFAPPEIIEQVSPIYFLDRWTAPITIHHGDQDTIVPPEWSHELCERLKMKQHPVECFGYANYRHNLYGSAEDVFTSRVISFFTFHRKEYG